MSFDKLARSRHHGVVVTLIAVHLLAASSNASTAFKTLTRLEPAGTWCPTGLTFGDLRPDFQSSDPINFNRGAYETSFTVPADGWVYVTLSTSDSMLIDNVLFLDRSSFLTGAGAFLSNECHRESDPTFPRVGVHEFDGSALGLPWRSAELFDGTTTDALRESGWELDNVNYLPGVSATERLPRHDQAAVVAECPGDPTCPLGSGSLELGADGGPSRLRFPVKLPPGNEVALQIWWQADPGARLQVRVDDFASCPAPLGTFFQTHESEVEVEILGADLDGGIDPNFIFFEDGSDTFGFVTVDSEVFAVPQIDNDDHPNWHGTALFRKQELGDENRVPIKIELYDADDFGIRAHVDINPDPTKRDLELELDLCSLQIEGDLSADMGGRIAITGDPGSGNDQGTVRFRIDTPTGRPRSTDDVAVTDIDVVQAVHRSRFVVAERPAVVMVTVANNFSTQIDTDVLVELVGPGGVVANRRFPVTLQPESAETFYFFEDTPVIVPGPTPGVESFLIANVTVDPDGVFSSGLDPDDCRLDNNTIVERFWKIVDTRDVHVTYCPVLRPLDILTPVPADQLADIRDLGTSFMQGVLPTASLTSGTCSAPMVITPLLAALAPLQTVLTSLGIPATAGDPFLLVWELNNFAMLNPAVDKILGIVRSAGWYEQFEGWDGVIGNSLGEAAQHAAILLPRVKDDAGVEHPKLTLPAHELAHTWGMSSDWRLKESVFCGFSFPFGPVDFGALMCGATGGLDEYSSSDPARAEGNPATGYWLPLGGEDPRVTPFMGPQCDRHCFMGRSEPNQLGDWAANGRWIDVQDWEHLIGELKLHPDPELLHVSGFFDSADNAFVGPWYRIPFGFPDRIDGDPGPYRVRFLDTNGDVLQDVGFPIEFGAADGPVTPPVTFFGFTVPWIDDTETIEIIRLAEGDFPEAVLAVRDVSANAPTVTITTPQDSPVDSESGLLLEWIATDEDGDPLNAVVMASDNGDEWNVLYGWIENDDHIELPAELFPGGPLQLKVVVMDGIHRGDSEPITVFAPRPSEVFRDGFEAGSVISWSVSEN